MLFSLVKDQIRDKNDALVCCLHWNMVHNGFRCIGAGENVSKLSTNNLDLIKFDCE